MPKNPSEATTGSTYRDGAPTIKVGDGLSTVVLVRLEGKNGPEELAVGLPLNAQEIATIKERLQSELSYPVDEPPGPRPRFDAVDPRRHK